MLAMLLWPQWIFAESRPVRVGMFIPKDPTFHGVHEVPEDQYVLATVQGEMPADWPIEALKAQAVVNRTYVRRNLGRHRKEGFDFCNLAHCQVYRENVQISPRVVEAVRSTAGEILLYEGKPIEVLFHSSCGGMTAASETIWPGHPYPYLQAQLDQDGARFYCRGSPDFRWKVHLTKRALAEVLRSVDSADIRRGDLQSLEIHERDGPGRVKTLSARWWQGEQTIDAYRFYLAWGRQFGWHKLKSTWFEIKPAGDGYDFIGRGLGHGVGLCQWGARGRAEAGQTYRDILMHYFPKTTISLQK